MERQITDAKSFWGALGIRATGVAIVTAAGVNGPSGFLALSATHLSASPPTMTISVSLTTSAYADIVASGRFAINYLSEDAGAVYQRFSAWDAPKGAERFAGLDYGHERRADIYEDHRLARMRGRGNHRASRHRARDRQDPLGQ